MAEFPEDLKYSMDDVWVRDGNDGTLRVGVSEELLRRCGSVLAVRLPVIGEEMATGDPCGELESETDSVEVICPAPGVVSLVNVTVAGAPEVLADDPYGDGWLFELELDYHVDLDDLLVDADDYVAEIDRRRE